MLIKFYERNSFNTEYFLGLQKLENVDSLIDLRVAFNQRLRFSFHITFSLGKAMSAVSLRNGPKGLRILKKSIGTVQLTLKMSQQIKTVDFVNIL